MPYTITNVALDRRYEGVRRRSYKLETEPYIAGRRLRVRRSMTLTDKQYRAARSRIEELERKGVLKISRDGDELRFPEVSSQSQPSETTEETGDEGTQFDVSDSPDDEQQETSEVEQVSELNEETEQEPEPGSDVMHEETEEYQQEPEQDPTETQTSPVEQVQHPVQETVTQHQQFSGKPHKGKNKGKNKGRK